MKPNAWDGQAFSGGKTGQLVIADLKARDGGGWWCDSKAATSNCTRDTKDQRARTVDFKNRCLDLPAAPSDPSVTANFFPVLKPNPQE